MFAAWWLPRFVLQALRVSPRDPAAVLDSIPGADTTTRDDTRLISVTERAEREGAHAGMTVSQAQARCPRLRLLYRDEKAEQAMQAQFLACAESWTPDYENTQPGLCVLDLNHIRWQHAQPWHERALRMHHDMQALGGDTRIGIADKADLAVLAAHIADPVRVLRAGVAEEQRALHSLPMSVLSTNLDLLRLLQLWGVRTLGEFIALPRTEIARRLGSAGLALHDLACGGRQRLLRLVRPPQVFLEEAELEAAIECLEPLMHLLGGMLARLCARLAQSWRVAGTLRLRLRFDDESTHARDLRIAEPTRDEPVLIRLLETSLEGVKTSAPIVFVSLELTPVRAINNQGSLFDQGLRDPNRFAETLSAIEAILGKGHVGRAEKLPSRRADAVRVTNFLTATNNTADNAPAIIHGLPLQRFRPPRPVRIILHDLRPITLLFGHETRALIATSGPWFLSGEWWDAQQSWQHEIWDAATDDGTLYRLICDHHAWHVEGLWG